ncbi:ubiquitin fusion degradation protein [Colletotrichum higginsianum]|nr:ubiquitin fusion degradation protein [Colletotrichum higginsianum]
MLPDVQDAYTLYGNPATTLLSLLSNPLILAHTAPHLSAYDRLVLASTSRAFRELIKHTSGVFRHLDLAQVRGAQFDIDGIDRGGEVWRNAQLDENLTEDECVYPPVPHLQQSSPLFLIARSQTAQLSADAMDLNSFYSGPLRGILSNIRRQNILQDVQTLILDGLSVTAELCHEIILDPAYNVRLLSIRGVKNLNERKLLCLQTVTAEGMPRLKGLYVFGAKDAPLLPMTASGVSSRTVGTPSQGAQIGAGWNAKSQQALTSSLRSEGEDWYQKKGRIIARPLVEEWANALVDCYGIIAFDGLACTGPHHMNSPAYGKVRIPPTARHWAVATVALGGCAGCGAAPEGMTIHTGTPAIERPLLSPPPLLTSSVKAATAPHSGPEAPSSSFVARCIDCLRERYCAGCDKWWCEECYQAPGAVTELADSDVIVVDAEGGTWVQHQEHEILPKIKVRNGACFPDCIMGEVMDAQRVLLR